MFIKFSEKKDFKNVHYMKFGSSSMQKKVSRFFDFLQLGPINEISKFGGIDDRSSDLHPSKVPSPIFITDDGIVIFLSVMHW